MQEQEYACGVLTAGHDAVSSAADCEMSAPPPEEGQQVVTDAPSKNYVLVRHPIIGYLVVRERHGNDENGEMYSCPIVQHRNVVGPSLIPVEHTDAEVIASHPAPPGHVAVGVVIEAPHELAGCAIPVGIEAPGLDALTNEHIRKAIETEMQKWEHAKACPGCLKESGPNALPKAPGRSEGIGMYL